MSDAKKCDRCGGYYMMGVNNDIRPSCDGVRIFGVRYITATKQNLGAHDLCPNCAAKVWNYVSEYDEPAQGEGADVVHADNGTGYDKGVVLKICEEEECEKSIVNCDTIVERSDKISYLKEHYGISMSSRNVTITYWPNFDTYLMTALVGSNNVEHQMVKGDVDYETLVQELLIFFGHLDMRYGNDTK